MKMIYAMYVLYKAALCTCELKAPTWHVISQHKISIWNAAAPGLLGEVMVDELGKDLALGLKKCNV